MAYRAHYTVTKRQSRFYFLSIVASVFLSLLALVSYFSGVSSVIGSVVNIILAPINSATSRAVDSVIGVLDYFSDIDSLKEENIRLLTENDRLRKENETAMSVLEENRELYSYIGLKKDFTDLTFVNARLIGRSEGAFMSTFTIDKGSLHGVKKGMPIITSSGVLGIVTEEALATSRCKSLTSHNFSAGIYILRTGVPGILEGDYELSVDGLCRISGLGSDTDIKVGDYIYTSGYGKTFPKDLCIGTVKEIFRDANTHTLTATVVPSSAPDNVNTVMVITSFERKYEDIQNIPQ